MEMFDTAMKLWYTTVELVKRIIIRRGGEKNLSSTTNTTMKNKSDTTMKKNHKLRGKIYEFFYDEGPKYTSIFEKET